ncbi:MAG TPA: zinc ABC transporter substrate-binding protein, partial [Candidatus Limiplasma pullicola]|nr:zinc ABC transporter substrate-binding protein [Candidatus Limiplasma pullicola]
RKTADVLAEETGAKELLFHSCHNVSTEELEGGATYLSLMWNNVAALKEALS